MSQAKHRGLRITLAVLAGIALLWIAALLIPTGPRLALPEGYEALADDALAAKFCPVFDCPREYGPIVDIYYRASKSKSDGSIYIAYHPVWVREWNSASGFGPSMNRAFYTGGLSLQKTMYGKGDIESIGLKLSPDASRILEIRYETARGYNASDFSVSHQNVVIESPAQGRPHFAVVSWNHLFGLAAAAPGFSAAGGDSAKLTAAAAGTSDGNTPAAIWEPYPAGQVPVSYFTSKLWNDYEMWKNPRTLLKKDRAHFVWERPSVR